MIRGMHRPVGLLLIALLLAAVFLLSLPDATAWQRVTQDAGHGPVFAGIAVILLWLQQPQDGIRPPRMYWRAFLIAAGLGVASELVQFFQNGRNVSLFDAIHDTAGAGLRTRARRDSKLQAAAGAAVCWPRMILVALVLLAWQPLRCAIAYAERSRAFPVLLQATRSADLYFARARDAKLERAAVPAPGTWTVSATPSDSSTCPGDDRHWNSRSRRPTGVATTGSCSNWSILASSRCTSRCGSSMRTMTGATKTGSTCRSSIAAIQPLDVQVSLAAVASAPARRPMDMGAIANVMLFAQAPLTGTEFYVTRIWLQ